MYDALSEGSYECVLDVLHEAVKRDGSLHRHAVLATDLLPGLFYQVMYMLFLWPKPCGVA